jgi:preprotein translocase subunit YajC
MPQNKERKKRDEMLKNIQRGDRVLTTGGIWGTVADIQENRLTVKIADNTRVEVERAYIQSVEKPA